MMYIGISLIMCSLIYSILVFFIFFSKPRVKTDETEFYKILLIVNVVNLILELGCFATISRADIIPITTFIVSRLFLVSLLSWTVIFSLYVFNVCLFNDKYKKILLSLKIFELLSYLLSVLIIFALPLHYFYEDKVMYSYGTSVDLVTTIFGINLFISLIVVFLNRKNVKIKKIFPLLLLIFLVGVCITIRIMAPGLNILSCVMAFITLFMYFTIENPDVKMVNALEFAKKQADKANQAKTEFLSSMSHEIRTPLNAIVGFSNSILEENDIDEIKDEAKDIVMASNNLLEIVNGILDISKIEAGKMEIVNVNYNLVNTLDDIVKLAKPRLENKPIELKYKYAKDIPGVLYGDQGKVKEIVTNILTNACKYTEKGTISLDVSCINENDISKLVIGIEDTGRGIKPEKIDKLFTKFNRLDEDKNTTLEGTGLGLAITKSLVDMMGGKIIVQSKYGKGSKFTVYLSQKIISMDNTLEKNNEEKVLELDYSNKKLLVVDDNNLNIKVACRMLKNYGIKPDTCLSGFECIDLVKKNNYDLILMDDMMPKMSGIETMNKLREDKKFKTPVVILTANAVGGMKEKYLNDGADDYLSKPIDKGELDRVLKEYLK